MIRIFFDREVYIQNGQTLVITTPIPTRDGEYLASVTRKENGNVIISNIVERDIRKEKINAILTERDISVENLKKQISYVKQQAAETDSNY